VTATPPATEFLDRVRARAAKLGRHDLPMIWALAVRDLDFPLTPHGYELLADPFTRWDELRQTPGVAAVIEWLLCDAKEQSNGLFFYGPTGSGKSFAAAFLCVVRHVLRPENGSEPVWIQAADLARRVLFERDIDLHARTMVIDDLGAGSVTDAQIGALEVVLDQRGKPGRATVITTNATTPSALQELYRARNASRMRGLFAKSLVLCNGDDLR
jgi:hypothetical protein